MRIPPPRRRQQSNPANSYDTTPNYGRPGVTTALRPTLYDTPHSDRAQMEPTRRVNRSPLANLQAFLNRRMKKQK